MSSGSMFKKAERKKLRLRMAIDGPTGSGKTVTALRIALALSPARRIAVIDTEHKSASKVIGDDYGEGPIEFDGVELETFSPSNYTAAIQDAGRNGFDVIVIDSLSHAWEGKDGALELVNKAGGNSYTAWKDVTPMHQAMVQAILSSPAHVICTMRSKMEYILEEGTNKQGKSVQIPRRIGMAPIQRQGMEYEFDIVMDMDLSHIGTVSKSRCRDVDGLVIAKPGRDFIQPVVRWLESGSQIEQSAPIAAKISDTQLSAVATLLNELGWKPTKLDKELPKRFSVTTIDALDGTQADELIKWLTGEKKLAAEKAERAKASAGPAAGTDSLAATGHKPAAQAGGGTNQPSPPALSPAVDSGGSPAPKSAAIDTTGFAMSPPDDPITAEQLAGIKALKPQLYAELMAEFDAAKNAGDVAKQTEIAGVIDQKWAATLAKRKVTTAKNLSRTQADELIKSMEKVIANNNKKRKDGQLNDWANQQVQENLASGQKRTAEQEAAAATTGKP